MSTNPMNCENCEYKQMNTNPELHCYMFKHEPTERCMQFKGALWDSHDTQFIDGEPITASEHKLMRQMIDIFLTFEGIKL